MQKILYQNDEGGLCIVHPTGALSLEETIQKSVPAGVTYQVIDGRDIPADRTFRNAWMYAGVPAIAIDMAKAIIIKQDMIRVQRTPLLAALDVEYMMALEKKDEIAAAEIAAKKQALRDATIDRPIIDAKTPEELKAADPIKAIISNEAVKA